MPSTILSDNGVTSGTSGIKTTGSNDGTLALQTTTAGGAATTALTVDTSQNVGIGITPSTSASSRKLLQIGGTSSVSTLAMTNGISEILSNTVYDGANFKYITTNYAASFDYNNAATGGFAWRLAPSGTAGNNVTLTEAMRIDSSGNLLVGTTSLYGGEKLAMLQSTNNRGFVIQQTNASNTSPPFLIDASRNTTNNTYNAIAYYNSGAGAYKFQVADSGSIATAGSVGLGTATPPNNGIGISFPATQSASSDANTLDDYEEGTWTPTVGGNATYTVQEGQYIKIGQLVFIFFDIQINVLGTGSTTTISGVPFTAANVPNIASAWTVSFSYYANIATAITWLSGYVPENATTISCSGNSTAATGIQSNGFAVFANSARISGSGVYRASA